MSIEMLALRESFVAVMAYKWSLLGVNTKVCIKSAERCELFVAVATRKWSLVGMSSEMILHAGCMSSSVVALRALVRLETIMDCLHMSVQAAS